MTASFPGKPR